MFSIKIAVINSWLITSGIVIEHSMGDTVNLERSKSSKRSLTAAEMEAQTLKPVGAVSNPIFGQLIGEGL